MRGLLLLATVSGSNLVNWYGYTLPGLQVLWAYNPGQEVHAWRYEAMVGSQRGSGNG